MNSMSMPGTADLRTTAAFDVVELPGGFDTTYLGTQSWNGTRVGATATTSLHREHFTLNWQQMVIDLTGMELANAYTELNEAVETLEQRLAA